MDSVYQNSLFSVIKFEASEKFRTFVGIMFGIQWKEKPQDGIIWSSEDKYAVIKMADYYEETLGGVNGGL